MDKKKPGWEEGAGVAGNGIRKISADSCGSYIQNFDIRYQKIGAAKQMRNRLFCGALLLCGG